MVFLTSMSTQVHSVRLSETVELPTDAVTQQFGLIARKGGGKTYAAKKLAEGMFEAGAQIIVLDTVGNWYGLRVDGKVWTSRGLPVVLIGGDDSTYADIRIKPHDGGRLGAALADEKAGSVVVDISPWSKTERSRFGADFAEEFFRAKKTRRTPVHLFLEEAQLLVPERYGGSAARMVGAFFDLIRLGRNYGIGTTLISQRPQSINKEVLSQTECLIVLQVNGTHERKALEAWVAEHGQDRALVGQLPGLETGEAFIWSPNWLRKFERIQIGKIKTYDSSATPRMGEKAPTIVVPPIATPGLAFIVDYLKPKPKEVVHSGDVKMTSTALHSPQPIEDPNVARLAAYRLTVDRLTQENAAYKQRLDRALSTAQSLNAKALALHADMEGFVKNLSDTIAAYVSAAPIAEPLVVSKSSPLFADDIASRTVLVEPQGMSKMARTILTAVAQHTHRGGLTKRQITTVTGYASSGHLSRTFAEIEREGWTRGNPLHITSTGLKALGPYEPLPEGRALLQKLINDEAGLPLMQRQLLAAVARAPGSGKGQILADCGYKSSGHASRSFASLTRVGYIEVRGGKVFPSKEFA